MKKTFTMAEAKEIGAKLGISFVMIDAEQFRLGLSVELEHGTEYPETNVTNDDFLMTGRIAWAHLREMPDYYTKLALMEAGSDVT